MRGNDATYFLSIEIRKVREVKVQCSKAQRSTVQRKAEKYSAAKSRKVQCSEMQKSTAQQNKGSPPARGES